jgi:hypothetical protein
MVCVVSCVRRCLVAFVWLFAVVKRERAGRRRDWNQNVGGRVGWIFCRQDVTRVTCIRNILSTTVITVVQQSFGTSGAFRG